MLIENIVDRMVSDETPDFTYETKDMKTRIMIHDWMNWMVKKYFLKYF